MLETELKLSQNLSPDEVGSNLICHACNVPKIKLKES